MARHRLLIVDGYSLLHRSRHLRAAGGDINRAREALLREVVRVAPLLAEETVIVFDGKTGPAGDRLPGNIRILFSTGEQSADALIERMVCDLADPATAIVVTSDRTEIDMVTAAGAQAMSCVSFLEHTHRAGEQIRADLKKVAQARPRPRLGDFFPR